MVIKKSMEKEFDTVKTKKKTISKKSENKKSSDDEFDGIKKKTISKKVNSEKEERVKVVRKTIPKPIKNKVWDLHIGKDKGIGECNVCSKEIDSKNYECGHIVAVSKGGENNIDNLLPICDECNKSMGSMDLYAYKTYVTSMMKTNNKSTKEETKLSDNKTLKEEIKSSNDKLPINEDPQYDKYRLERQMLLLKAKTEPRKMTSSDKDRLMFLNIYA